MDNRIDNATAQRIEELNAEFWKLNLSGKVSSWPVVTPECIRMREVLDELEEINDAIRSANRS